LERFMECFCDVADPRKHAGRYALIDILFIALLATLSGATSCCDMAVFAQEKSALLGELLGLDSSPSHDTFSRIFRLLDPKSFEKAFRRFTKAFAEAVAIEGVVALDGKSLRRAYEKGKSHMPPLMVTAWSTKTRLALANAQAPNNNEVAAVLELIGLLQLEGCIVTTDSLHCHRKMAQAVVTQQGDYVLAVKDNQPGLLADAKTAIAAAQTKKGKAKKARTREKGHGRIDTRKAIVVAVPDMAEKHNFQGLKAVALITSDRGDAKPFDRYFLMSQHYTPQKALEVTRAHWGIENHLHWRLDVVFDEDQNRSRKDNAPANLAILKRMALNAAQSHPDKKTSMRAKLKRAAWNDDYLLQMIANVR